MTERGQISIPARIRREMHLKPGQVVIFERVSETECRILVDPQPVIKPDPVAAVGFARRHGLPTMTTRKWMDLLREGDEEITKSR